MKKPKNGGFYWEREVYQSDAFLTLGKNAMKLLIALYDVRERETTSQSKDKKGVRRKPKFVNLDRLEMPYTTLEKKYKMNQQAITRAIDELLAKGFIEINHHGGVCKHDKSRYGLTDDYLTWKEGMIIRKRQVDVKRGYQGKCLGATQKV